MSALPAFSVKGETKKRDGCMPRTHARLQCRACLSPLLTSDMWQPWLGEGESCRFLIYGTQHLKLRRKGIVISHSYKLRRNIIWWFTYFRGFRAAKICTERKFIHYLENRKQCSSHRDCLLSYNARMHLIWCITNSYSYIFYKKV